MTNVSDPRDLICRVTYVVSHEQYISRTVFAVGNLNFERQQGRECHQMPLV